jgi:hypothetical protein
MGRIGFPVRRGAQRDVHPSGKQRSRGANTTHRRPGLFYPVASLCFFADAGGIAMRSAHIHGVK